MENKPDLLDKLEKYLMEDVDEIANLLDVREMEILKRYKAGYLFWMDRPSKTPTQIAKYLQKFSKSFTGKAISRATAYRDVKNIQVLLGKIRDANKDWKRYQLEQMAMETYRLAKKDGNHLAMTAAIDKFGKYNQLDKEDVEQIPWEKLNIPQWVPSSDATLAGVERDPNLEQTKRELKEKYGIKDTNSTPIIHIKSE